MAICATVQQVLSHTLALAWNLFLFVAFFLLFWQMWILQNQALDLIILQNGGGHLHSNISFRVDTSSPLQGYAMYQDAEDVFSMTIKTAERGTHILEIFLNGTQVLYKLSALMSQYRKYLNGPPCLQIPNSPFLIEIVDRNCSPGKTSLIDCVKFALSSKSNGVPNFVR